MIIWQTWARAADYPLFIIYLFVCWLLLIIAGGLVAWRLQWPGDARPQNAPARDGDDR